MGLSVLILVSSFLFFNENKITAHADFSYDKSEQLVYFCRYTEPFSEKLETSLFYKINYFSVTFFLYSLPSDKEQAKQDLLKEVGYNSAFDTLGQAIQCLKVNGIDYKSIINNDDQSDAGVWNALAEISKENPEWFLKHAPNLGLSAFDLDYCKMDPTLLSSILNDKISQINSVSNSIEKGVTIGNMRGEDSTTLESVFTANTLISGELVKCHVENNIPLEIPNLSPNAKSLFLAMQDYELQWDEGPNKEFAPNFNKFILNAPSSTNTPEFNRLAGLIIATSMICVVIITRRFVIK